MLSSKLIKQFSSKVKATPNNLSSYDIVIVGANNGGILSRQLETILNNRFNVFVVYNNQYNQCNHLDIAFQQGHLTFEKYVLEVNKTLSPTTAHSDGIGISQYLPEENSILLTNGRRISYKQLVISAGLQQDLDQIKGLKDALEDNGHPVFGAYIDSIAKVDTAKKPQHFYKFNGGKSYFYIPPFPVQGEGAAYNFFAAFDTWKENQKRYLKKTTFSNLDIEFQVINANSTFAQHSTGLNEFIIQELQNRGIKYQLNTRVNEINKNDRVLTLNDSENKSFTLEYDNFYTIIPTKSHENLVEANLANNKSNNLLNVAQDTLQHNVYKNIFGLGDVCNIPTTRSYSSGQHQLNVVRNNVFRNITGQYLNAFYDGFSKVPIYLSNNKLTWFSHYYDNKKGPLSLLDTSGGIISSFRYYLYSKVNPFWNTLYYTGKIYGPPFQFWAKGYKELNQIPEEQVKNWQEQADNLANRFSAIRRESVPLQQVSPASASGASVSVSKPASSPSSTTPKQQQQQQPPKVEEKQEKKQTTTTKSTTTKASEKYTKTESATTPPKRKRGRPKKNPGDATDQQTE